MVHAGDLHERGAGDLLRHGTREDGALLAADDQGRAGDPGQEGPGIHGLARAVAGRVETVGPLALALDDPAPGQVGQEGRWRYGGAGEEAKGRDGGLGGRVTARGTVAALVHHRQPVLGNGRAAVHDHQPLDALGMPGGEGHGVVTAHGMADEGHGPPAESLHHPEQIPAEVLGPVGGRLGPLALAVPPLIQGEDVEAVGEGGRHGVEPVGVGRPAVEEQETREAGSAPFEAVEAQGVDGQAAASRRFAAEALEGIHATDCSPKRGGLQAVGGEGKTAKCFGVIRGWRYCEFRDGRSSRITRRAAPPLHGRRPPPPGSVSPPVEPRPAPKPVEGQVVDADTKSPIAGASIHSGSEEIRADAEGRFRVGGPQYPLIVKAPGYGRLTLETAISPLAVSLHPKVVKAAYLTYYCVGDKGIRGRVLELLNRTELNGVVIDVKGDRGWIPYRTEVPLAREAGARGPVNIKEFDQMLADLKARGVYTIARIVVFKDGVLAHHKPEWAVIDTRTGQPWLDNERLAWLDPFREEVWDYAIAIAKEAAQRSEEHTSELQSPDHLVCRLLLDKKHARTERPVRRALPARHDAALHPHSAD